MKKQGKCQNYFGFFNFHARKYDIVSLSDIGFEELELCQLMVDPWRSPFQDMQVEIANTAFCISSISFV